MSVSGPPIHDGYRPRLQTCYDLPVLPKDLLEILVCPRSKQALIYFPRGESNREERDGFLLCPGSGLRYRVEAGVPVMLVEEADLLPQTAVLQLVARARELGLPVPA